MQIFRLLYILALMMTVMVYFYIYVRNAFSIYGFYGLIITFIAFICLFIGSGKQVVYQQLVELGKIDYKNKKKKSNLWLTGVFLYGQAIPMVYTSLFVYYISSKDLMSIFPKQFHIDNSHYQSLKQDINQGLEIFYAR